jgi:hypothetical protein
VLLADTGADSCRRRALDRIESAAAEPSTREWANRASAITSRRSGFPSPPPLSTDRRGFNIFFSSNFSFFLFLRFPFTFIFLLSSRPEKFSSVSFRLPFLFFLSSLFSVFVFFVPFDLMFAVCVCVERLAVGIPVAETVKPERLDVCWRWRDSLTSRVLMVRLQLTSMPIPARAAGSYYDVRTASLTSCQ